MDEPIEGPTPDAPKPDAPTPLAERLDPRVVPYWLVSGLAGFVVLVAIVLAALWYFAERVPIAPRTTWTLAGVLLGAQGVWTLLSPPLAHRVWRFRIDDRLLVARYGIIVRQEKVIPTNRLQHVDLVRGPIERLFGLATLIVHTAGTEAVAFRLPGLAAARATELRDHILRARGADVV